MPESLQRAGPKCASCAGEGFRFEVKNGGPAAVACACTGACSACSGSGRVYGRDERGYEVLRGCGCGADPRRLAILTGLHLPLKFLDSSLANYSADSPEQARAQGRACRFIDEFVPGATGTRALMFCGPPGTGKTHLLTAILRELAVSKSVRGRYEEFFLLLSDIRDGFSRGLSSREWLEPLRSVEVLAIDEVGKGGKNREWEEGILDEIISVRYNAGRPTLMATNYPPYGADWQYAAAGETAETLDQRVGPRIYSRLHALCDLVQVKGPDRRKEDHHARNREPNAAARGTRPARG